jgi:hypothetical protein
MYKEGKYDEYLHSEDDQQGVKPLFVDPDSFYPFAKFEHLRQRFQPPALKVQAFPDSDPALL